MANQYKVGKTATSVFTEDGWTRVVYHATCVIKWNDKQIVLDSGGWRTATTKTRINQASNQFGLGIGLYQKNHEWYVVKKENGAWPEDYKSASIPFTDGMAINR